MEKKKKSFWSRLRNKYRLVVLNDETFEEKISMRLSRMNVFVSLTFGVVFLIGATTLLIAFTPLREYIPGYASTRMRQQLVDLSNKTDSLEDLTKIIDQHQRILKSIIAGEVPEGIAKEGGELDEEETADLDLKPAPTDLNFRNQIEEEEQFNFGLKKQDRNLLENLLFFKPVEGVVSDGFDPQKKHFGVDIAAKKKAPIHAVLDGVVIQAGWNPETGNVITVQHKNNMISMYKHNAELLKTVGAPVQAGEAIAIVGSTGTLSTDIHLHFELWLNGQAVNPENYILF